MPFVSLPEMKTAIMSSISKGFSASVIGLDLGSQFIGVAKTDGLCQMVSPVGGFHVSEPSAFPKIIESVIAKHEPLGVVYGVPSGDQNHSKGFRRKMEKLEEYLKERGKATLMVEMDETCTTVASRVIIKKLEKQGKTKKNTRESFENAKFVIFQRKIKWKSTFGKIERRFFGFLPHPPNISGGTR